MPRLRKEDAGRVLIAEAVIESMNDRTPELLDLLAWVGRTIVVRNANGRTSDKFCRLCQTSRHHKEKCRHAEVWQLVR